MSQSDIEVILYRLSDLDKKVDELRSDLKAADLIREGRIRNMESIMDQLKGAGTAGKAMWALVGAGGIGAVVSIANLLSKNG
jgi:Tfp pilus assembly ATPase PilU